MRGDSVESSGLWGWGRGIWGRQESTTDIELVLRDLSPEC